MILVILAAALHITAFAVGNVMKRTNVSAETSFKRTAPSMLLFQIMWRSVWFRGLITAVNTNSLESPAVCVNNSTVKNNGGLWERHEQKKKMLKFQMLRKNFQMRVKLERKLLSGWKKLWLWCWSRWGGFQAEHTLSSSLTALIHLQPFGEFLVLCPQCDLTFNCSLILRCFLKV